MLRVSCLDRIQFPNAQIEDHHVMSHLLCTLKDRHSHIHFWHREVLLTHVAIFARLACQPGCQDCSLDAKTKTVLKAENLSYFIS